jgi:hypothetical protein
LGISAKGRAGRAFGWSAFAFASRTALESFVRRYEWTTDAERVWFFVLFGVSVAVPVAALILGCYEYAKSKNRHGGWATLGVLWYWGPIFLLLLRDFTPGAMPEGPRERKLKLCVQYVLGGSMIIAALAWSVLAAYVRSKSGDQYFDGLGRPIWLAPWFARFYMSEELWPGLWWHLLDVVGFFSLLAAGSAVVKAAANRP